MAPFTQVFFQPIQISKNPSQTVALFGRDRLLLPKRVFRQSRYANKMKSLLIIALFVSLNGWSRADDAEPIVLYRIGPVPVDLRTEDNYAVMLINDGGEKNPSPRYILGIAKTRTVIDTKDIELFESVLSRIPRGTTLFEYGSCTVPRSWGLKEEHFKEYARVFKELGLKISDEPRTTCYCGSVGG